MRVLSTSLFLAAVLITTCYEVSAQTERHRDFRNVFEEIQHGFETSNVALFSPHFAPQVQVNIKGDESGYYSSNQTYYVLENFFRSRKMVSFEFTNVGETETSPYGTGRAVCINKGSRENMQVYMALIKSNGRWMISEINIY